MRFGGKKVKDKFYKYGVTALISASVLVLAGCKTNENTPQSSSKSKSSAVKIEKKNETKDRNKKVEVKGEKIKRQNSENTSSKNSNKVVEKLPVVSELMKNISSFNEGSFDISIEDTSGKERTNGLIQEDPRVVHFKNGSDAATEFWATDQFIYRLDDDKWIKYSQTARIGRYDPIINMPAETINQMKVSKTNNGYQVIYQGNSSDVKDLIQKYIVVASGVNKDPFNGQDLTSATLTYTFNKQKQLTEIHYEWLADSNKGKASYTNINQQKIAVPADVIQAADKNPDSINNQNGSTDD